MEKRKYKITKYHSISISFIPVIIIFIDTCHRTLQISIVIIQRVTEIFCIRTKKRFVIKKGSLSKWRTFFPVTLKFSRTLSKWRINHQKVRHFDKRSIIPEFSKWRTFIGRSYQNGELFESKILVARSSLLVIC